MQESLSLSSQERMLTTVDQLRKAVECLTKGRESHRTNTEYAAEMYHKALSFIESCLQHFSLNQQVENSISAFYCKAQASYFLGLIYHEKEAFKKSNAVFIDAALVGVNSLEINYGHDSRGAQQRRDFYFKIIQNSLLAIRNNFSKSRYMAVKEKYLTEYLPLLRKGLSFISDKEKYNELTIAFNTFENHLSTLTSHGFYFWNACVLLPQNNENSNSKDILKYKPGSYVRK